MKLGQRTLHIAAAQATGAYVHPLCLTVDQNAHILHVGSPDAIGLAIGVADVVAAHGTLLAHFAKLAHDYTS